MPPHDLVEDGLTLAELANDEMNPFLAEFQPLLQLIGPQSAGRFLSAFGDHRPAILSSPHYFSILAFVLRIVPILAENRVLRRCSRFL
jgi:hypothetical protein